MTAGPPEEGVAQEKQTVITALCPASHLYHCLTYSTLHSLAGLQDNTNGEKSQTVITALCPAIICTSFYSDHFEIYAVLWLNVKTHLTCRHSSGFAVPGHYIKVWIAVKTRIGALYLLKQTLMLAHNVCFHVCATDGISQAVGTAQHTGRAKKK